MKKLYILVCALCLTWLMCTSNQIAGGTGTETTNSFAYLGSGAPAAYCRILLIDSEVWKKNAISRDFIIDSAVSGNDGSFSFRYNRLLRNRKFNIQIDHDSAGLFRREIAFANMDTLTFKLSKYSVVHGFVNDTGKSGSILIEGTDYKAQINSDGTFEQKVPEGVYALFVKNGASCRSCGSVTVPADTEIEVNLPSFSNEELLVTDFESGYSAPCIKADGVSVFWYLYSDSTAKSYDYETSKWVLDTSGDFSKLANTSVNSSIEKNSDGNSFLNVDVSFDKNYPSPYGGLGIVLYTENDRGMDFSTFNALRCDINGQGTVTVILIVKHPVYNAVVRFYQTRLLSIENHTIDFDFNLFTIDSDTPDSLQISWEEARRHVRLIEFGFFKQENRAENDVYLDLDNVVFVGTGK